MTLEPVTCGRLLHDPEDVVLTDKAVLFDLGDDEGCEFANGNDDDDNDEVVEDGVDGTPFAGSTGVELMNRLLPRLCIDLGVEKASHLDIVGVEWKDSWSHRASKQTKAHLRTLKRSLLFVFVDSVIFKRFEYVVTWRNTKTQTLGDDRYRMQ